MGEAPSGRGGWPGVSPARIAGTRSPGAKVPAPLILPHPAPSLLPLPPQAVEEEDIPKQKEQTHFTVRLTEAKPVDKVKLIKEIKNYVQGINLVQVSVAAPAAGRLGAEPGRPLTWLSAGEEAGGVAAPGNQSQRRQGRGGEDQGGSGGGGRHRGPGVGSPRTVDRGPWDPGEARPPRPAPRLS